ncbi:hypothetical protein MA3A0930S_1249 [Mycobacteroides abscessus 3A-0930-S]|nr:hypothetical protein MA3A0122R_1632 [Mycobacteroides abscessus 3A-0122-R]EIV56090.1 hypothetical protein MA3A0930S_1249 [Mycobacteroides abscessus 3A-0930-S]EIV56955.1 hypothetical protein MA3A0930R_1690 [Mycobacteroides abscessus 3A-0930-R]EIV82844.1 hypothetical protein MM3A0810R_1648 [Mycobacteroides abscessus 3A-0810-R]
MGGIHDGCTINPPAPHGRIQFLSERAFVIGYEDCVLVYKLVGDEYVQAARVQLDG